MAHLNFPETFPLPEAWLQMLSTEPRSQVGLETVEDRLHISSVIQGAGVHVIVIEKTQESD